MSITRLKQWELEERRKQRYQRKKQGQLQPQLLYDDEHLVIVNKPAGMHSIPDRWNPLLPNVRSYLQQKFRRKVFTVHRLDKGTSGVMIFALTPEAHRHLNEQFEQRAVKKVYHTLVEGQFPYEELLIDIPLRKTQKGDRVYPAILGKEALTHVRQLQQFRRATLLECELLTGRHHQIRVHLATLGFPLLVDEVYGLREAFFLSEIKYGFKRSEKDEEHPLIHRLTLHAHQLQFQHPVTGESLTVKAPYPRDFAAVVRMLHKYSAVDSPESDAHSPLMP